MTITRRDFLNGVALTIAAGLTPMQLLRAAPAGRYYPPALTGPRGSHPGAFEVAHQMGWEKRKFDYSKLDVTGRPVRLRLNSTAVSVKNREGGVDVGYSRGGQLVKVRSKHCVLA